MSGQRISPIQRLVGEAAQRAETQAQKERQDRIIEVLIELQASGIEKSIAYANIILLGGYASMFTLLQVTKSIIPSTWLVITALCLVISLISFCGWEIAKMVVFARQNKRHGEILFEELTPEELDDQLSKERKKAQRETVKMGQWWLAVVCLTIGPAVVAAFILVYFYLVYLVAGI